MKNYKKRILLFLYISLLIVLSSFSILFFNFKKQLNLQSGIILVEKKLAQVDSININLLRLESDKRGFQLTNDYDYLRNYMRNKRDCQKNIETLFRLSSSSNTETATIQQIDSLIRNKFNGLDSGLKIMRNAGAGAALAYMQDPERRKFRMALGTALEQIKKRFDKQLHEITADINAISKRNNFGLFTLLVVFVILMLVAARAFRLSQQRIIKKHMMFKDAQRIAKTGSWELNLQTNKMKWSEEQFRIFGETRGDYEPTFKKYMDHFSPEDQEKINQTIGLTIDGKQDFAIEHDLIRKDGVRLTVSEQGRILYDDKKRVIGIFGTTRDITDQKKAEEEVLKAQKKFQSIFDNSADGIYQSTPDGKFVMANASMARIFGYRSSEELINSIADIGIQIYANPDDRKNMSDLLAAQGHILNYELEVLTKQQKPIWVSANIRCIKNKAGQVLYYEGTLEDICARKLAEQEILQLNKSLEQFANITAHDLQEPIRMVSGFLGLLEKKYNDQIDEQGRSYIFRAKDGADRMSVLIRDLLEFSRSGNKAARKEPVNLALVIDLVQKDMSIVIQDTSARLWLPEQMPVVMGTQSALYRLFLNLVSNGIKFRKKDMPPEVAITLNENTDYWEFTIQDNGIGVADKDKSKLFQAFQRLHKKEDYPGTGLGLVTCKKIVETHEGKIWMTSEYGKGTAFHFTLPKMRA
jgi:PAS domain S-box-containing protein